MKKFKFSLIKILVFFISFEFTLYAQVIPNSYIIVLKDNVNQMGVEEIKVSVEEQVHKLMQKLEKSKTSQKINSIENSVQSIYRYGIKGFSATLSESDVHTLGLDDSVDYIEPNRMVFINSVQTSTPSWGLDRLDSPELLLDDNYHYNKTGRGVHAYIVDSGINANHEEFQGRIGSGYDFIENDAVANDENGHGTHVAGTIGGTKYGVSKEVTLHSLKVFAATGGTPRSVILNALDWILANHQAPAVVNMSLGGEGVSEAYRQMISKLVRSGIVVVVAAGNSTADACNFSPAFSEDAITVASSDRFDYFSYFSNYGNCVDIIAPGEDIVSADFSSNNGSDIKSGTSMASPHVTGAVALYFETHPNASVTEVKTSLFNQSSKNKIKGYLQETPNQLLYTLESTIIPPSTKDSWTTGHYENNADISKELSIEGATSLIVTVEGEVEQDYDYIIITDKEGNEQHFTGTLNETFMVQGSSITAQLISDDFVTKSGVSIEITKIEEESNTTNWDTGHYKNNVDISKKLSIEGATSLTVTVEGEVEQDYDYIIITDSEGNEQHFTGKLSETFTVEGSSITAQLISDSSIIKSGVIIKITKKEEGSNPTNWDTGHYENNADISKELFILEANALIVTLEGEVEDGYDYIIITAELGASVRFTGQLNERFWVEGSTLQVQLISDDSVRKSGVEITIIEKP